MRNRLAKLRFRLPIFSYLKTQSHTLHLSSMRYLDGWLVLSSLTLLALGWIMVSSASVAVAEFLSNNAQHYAIRQGIFMVLALFAAFVISQISLVSIEKYGHLFLVFAFMLLSLVLVFGREINGSTR